MDRSVSKEDVARKLEQLPPEFLAEIGQFIDSLQFRTTFTATAGSTLQNGRRYPAFSLWASRWDIEGSDEYAERHRRSA